MILPKKDKNGTPLLSYTQVSLWRKSKREYIQKYFYNDQDTFTAYMDFGSKVGEALEKGDFSEFSESEQKVLAQIKRLDEFERFIEIPFDGFKFIGYIDTNDNDLTYVIDYKTGAEDKIQEYKKDDYFQLKLYAAAIQKSTGKLPDKAEVILIERLGNPFKGGDPLRIGTQTWTIPQDISPDAVEEALEAVSHAAGEISKYYQVFKKLNV